MTKSNSDIVLGLAAILKNKIAEKGELNEQDLDMANAAVDVGANAVIAIINLGDNTDRIADALERANDLLSSPVLAPTPAAKPTPDKTV